MKLNPIDCADIRARRERNEKWESIAIDYGVSVGAVQRAVRRKSRPTLWPLADWLPFDEDPIAQAVVWECAPLSQEQVGGIMGLTRQRVEQIEQIAYRKIRDEHGDDVLLELLTGWAEVREARDARQGVAA